MCNVHPIFIHLLTDVFSKPSGNNYSIAECSQSFSFLFLLFSEQFRGEKHNNNNNNSNNTRTQTREAALRQVVEGLVFPPNAPASLADSCSEGPLERSSEWTVSIRSSFLLTQLRQRYIVSDKRLLLEQKKKCVFSFPCNM